MCLAVLSLLLVGCAMGQALFARANEPKRFYAVTGADHNEVAVVGGRPYLQAMDEFLREVAGK